MSRHHEHLAGEDLLALLLERGAAGARARVAACATCAEELSDLERFVATCRAALAPELAPGAAGAPALVERVLARTTREDPGWRGDLRLVGRFVGERLRASRALRVAAASLLVHLLALPLLAWLAWRPAPRPEGFASGVLPAPVDPFLPARGEELGELELRPEPELRSAERDAPPPVRAWEARAYLRASRRALQAARPPAPGEAALEGSAPPTLARLLDARARLLAGEALAPAALESAPAELPALERALLVELLLDAQALREDARPQEDAALRAALGSLGRDPAAPAAERALELLALRRAAASGLLDEGGGARSERLEAGLAGSGARPGGGRDPDPLDAAWLDAFRRAVAGRGEDAQRAAAGWLRAAR